MLIGRASRSADIESVSLSSCLSSQALLSYGVFTGWLFSFFESASQHAICKKDEVDLFIGGHRPSTRHIPHRAMHPGSFPLMRIKHAEAM